MEESKAGSIEVQRQSCEGLLERIVSCSVYKAEDGREKEGWLEAGHIRTVVWPRR